MKKWLLLITLPFFLAACGGGSSTATKPAAEEKKPAVEQKAEAPKAAAAASTGEWTGGPFPAAEEKMYKIIPSVTEECCFNGIGWEKGSASGSALLFKGKEMAIESPNSFGDSLRTLTFKLVSWDAATGVLGTKVDSTDAFGEGALNNFWASVPYAKVKIILNGKNMQFRFGEPADTIDAAVAPDVPDSNPKFRLK